MKQEENKSKKEKRGLYFALAVCLLAVGIAAWGTYNSVSDYVKVKSDGATTLVRQERTPKDEDPEAKPTTAPQATPAPTPKAVEEQANTQPEIQLPERQEPEVQVPAPETPAKEDLMIPETPAVDGPTYTMQESFVYPVQSKQLLAPYSGDTLVYNETMRDYRTHNGIDFSASKSEAVLAANGGLVKETFSDLLLGNVVVIEHGERELWYCGLGDTFLVKVGDTVAPNTPIGSIAQVPSESTTTHLHLQVKENGNFVDPAALSFAE